MEHGVFIGLGPLHPHFVFETLAYSMGYWAYRYGRARAHDFLKAPTRLSLLVAGAIGAALGSKLLVLLVDPSQLGQHLSGPLAFMASGKTMVGGLLGGWGAIELTKAWLGVKERTGDLYALPLCLAVAVGRVGCFFTGLPDRTYGLPTALPWGIDFGDGFARHPTQLYEICFLALLAVHISKRARGSFVRGALFREFALGYLTFRLLIDFLKPSTTWYGLDAIQWACTLALSLQLLLRYRTRT